MSDQDLRDALEPFCEYATAWDGEPDEKIVCGYLMPSGSWLRINVGDLRRACRAFGATGEQTE